MRIYCTTDADDAIPAICRAMGLTPYEYDDVRQPSRGQFAGHDRAVKLLLRPVTDDYRSAKPDAYVKGGTRRIWAASWAGHYVFMRALLEIDENAVIHTSTATYRGLEDFDASAMGTASRNVGSMRVPVRYRDAQVPDHVEWSWEDDLADRALEIVARVRRPRR